MNEPFIAVVIDNDAISLSPFWEQEFTKRSYQISTVIIICVHGSCLLCDGMLSICDRIHRMIKPLDNYLHVLRLLLAVERLCRWAVANSSNSSFDMTLFLFTQWFRSSRRMKRIFPLGL